MRFKTKLILSGFLVLASALAYYYAAIPRPVHRGVAPRGILSIQARPHKIEANSWASFDWSQVPFGATVQVMDQINTEKIKPLQMRGCKGGLTIKGPARIEGFYFDFHGIHGITWENISFVNCGQFRAEGSTWIAAVGCTFSRIAKGQDIWIQLGPGNDNWTIDRCLIEFAGCGIYTRFGNGPPANRLLVLNSTFRNIGTAEYPHADSHAVGVQEGSGHLISGCSTDNTGEAISLWARRDKPMTNILIQNCTIRNVRACANTEGHGIVVSGSHDFVKELPKAGWRAGIQIAHNDIAGAAGNGIRSNARDKVFIFGNTIAKCGREPIFLHNHFGSADWSGVKGNAIQ